jgi:hypothetical protein
LEIKNKILRYIFQYERENNIRKSKQHYLLFKKYDEITQLSYKIDFDKYRIGDCVIHRGNTSYAFRPKKIYIRSWCIKCKGPNNEELSNNYFTNKYNKYVCKSCRNVESYGGMAILADTDYKICKNCYERFKYTSLNKDIYCELCQTIRIFEPNEIINKSCLKCVKYYPKLCEKHFEELQKVLDYG